MTAEAPNQEQVRAATAPGANNAPAGGEERRQARWSQRNASRRAAYSNDEHNHAKATLQANHDGTLEILANRAGEGVTEISNYEAFALSQMTSNTNYVVLRPSMGRAEFAPQWPSLRNEDLGEIQRRGNGGDDGREHGHQRRRGNC